MAKFRYVISDLHFGHVALAYKRGFDSVHDHDKALIRNWNRVVPDYGEVAVRRTATWSKKPPTPKYSDTQKWYNSILGIGSDDDENEESGSDELVSVMFRRSIK